MLLRREQGGCFSFSPHHKPVRATLPEGMPAGVFVIVSGRQPQMKINKIK